MMSGMSYSDMVFQNQMMLIMTLFSSMMSTMMAAVVKAISDKIGATWATWTVRKRTDLGNMVKLQRELRENLSGSTTVDSHRSSATYFTAFMELMAEKQQEAKENTIKVVEMPLAKSAQTTRELLLNTKSLVQPSLPIYIDGFRIEFSSDRSEEKETATIKNLQNITVSSVKSVRDITEFIERVHKDWVLKNYPVQIPGKETLYAYEQTDSETKAGSAPVFKRYPIERNFASYDDLFFDGKTKLDSLLKAYQDGKRQRIGVMMSGEPGGGKTSLVRSIAVMQNSHVICLNLALIRSDSDLKDILLGKSILCLEESGTSWDRIDFRKRIYLIDEADCGSDVLLDRETQARHRELKRAQSGMVDTTQTDDKPVLLSSEIPIKTDGSGSKSDAAKDTTVNSTKKSTKDNSSPVSDFPMYKAKDRLTTRGILDAFDGLTQMRGILFICTNRPDDIDKAIKRPGRIDYHLKLGRLSKENILKVIHSQGFKTPSDGIEIPDNLLMGCSVSTVCMMSSTDEELSLNLQEEIGLQRAVLEKETVEASLHVENVKRLAAKAQEHQFHFMNSHKTRFMDF